MKKIKTLTPNVIAKIAAGEVVERPASIVKELIENSLDAHAQSIKIELENYGLKSIKVVDDGVGMSKEDLHECYKPHTTSKLFYEDDLVSISTLGFRGEALASISAIASLAIQSREQSSISGNSIEIVKGKVKEFSSIGMPVGTVIYVRDVFAEIPARKKFLKSPQAELKKILEVVINAAIANPHVGFFLANDKKIKLDVAPNQSLKTRLAAVLNSEFAENLIRVAKEGEIQIKGYVGKPQISYINRNRQFLYVNGRSVKNDLISRLVSKTYGTALMTKDHPAFILFLTLPTALFDINIHPRKEEVAFAESVDLESLITEALNPVFSSKDLSYKKHGSTESDFFEYAIPAAQDLTLHDSVGTEDYTRNPIYQFHNLYLMTQTRNGILIVDQHAAHERILYEKFLEIFKTHAKETLLKPAVLLNLTLTEAESLNEHLEIFKKMGFEIEEFGFPTFRVKTIPYFLKNVEVVKVVKEILEDLQVGRTPKDLDEKTDRAISYTSCKSAIKAGDYLTETERIDLLTELSKTKTSYVCPHGRPVKVELSLNELAKIFRRK